MAAWGSLQRHPQAHQVPGVALGVPAPSRLLEIFEASNKSPPFCLQCLRSRSLDDDIFGSPFEAMRPPSTRRLTPLPNETSALAKNAMTAATCSI